MKMPHDKRKGSVGTGKKIQGFGTHFVGQLCIVWSLVQNSLQHCKSGLVDAVSGRSVFCVPVLWNWLKILSFLFLEPSGKGKLISGSAAVQKWHDKTEPFEAVSQFLTTNSEIRTRVGRRDRAWFCFFTVYFETLNYFCFNKQKTMRKPLQHLCQLRREHDRLVSDAFQLRRVVFVAIFLSVFRVFHDLPHDVGEEPERGHHQLLVGEECRSLVDVWTVLFWSARASQTEHVRVRLPVAEDAESDHSWRDLQRFRLSLRIK